MRRPFLGVGTLAAVATLGATWAAASASYITLDREAQPLKSVFNADSGKTRILMLVAPT